ncbi:peptidoglycan editing factor PgeF [Flexivirga sp. ID2601S]|uniref:Purine nucleoside phosphorylase n=1 Tax=Flexivirga aerilata TaxID=1656889 RepID=A0A849AFN3_9MICO|nr:peptidoglycan editing factor PgeF [Flexivirga aerilata]NNG39644.1 peptidoglycan editing factor PgeF [Flexivirga aerilata]
MWWWQDTLRTTDGRVVEVGFTDTEGGVSDGPLRSLNLGGKVGDDPENVRRNRAAVAAAAGVRADRLVFMQQTHSTHVARHDPQATEAVDADGIVSAEPDTALAVLVADCTPVLLADPAAGVIGAVHSGRPGMVGRIVDNALDAMAALGATNPVAIVGPSVCGRCYEVPAQMRDEAAAVTPASRAVSWTGTPAIDVAGGVVAQLAARDVPVTWVPGCTRESDRLFSYRRDHATGRFAGVIVLRGGAA